jgi:outer membrane protein assembly factor BamB
MKTNLAHLVLLSCSLITSAIAVHVQGAPWPQYRGPQGDGRSLESLARPWPADGPKTLWKTPSPSGFSSFAVSSNVAFTLVRATLDGADREVCVALDATTGQELWKTPVGVAKYDGGGDDGKAGNKGGDGPRSTPTVDGDRVYVLTAQLVLACLDTRTGRPHWTRDIIRENAGRGISWQNAASPVLDGNLVFVAGGGPGQSLLGIDKRDGKVVWKGEDDRMTHATPVIATVLGQRQVIFFTQKGLVAVKPEDGRVLWRYGFRYNVSTAASPVVANDLVYCAAGYDVGSAAVRISRQGDQFTATEVWRQRGNRPVANHWSTPVHHNGHLYGMFSFKEYGDGPLKCVELATGKVVWEKPGFGAGNVILAGNHLLALADTGSIVMVQATPSGYQELARTRAVEGKCWTTPALAEGKLFVRSVREAACLDLSPFLAKP